MIDEAASQRPEGHGCQATTRTTRPERETDEVVCFFSGRSVPRDQAVRVKLAPGQRVWMLREFCRDG